MPASSTDRGCPLYSCMSLLIHSHLWMSSPAGNPHFVTSSRTNTESESTALYSKNIEICLSLSVPISVSLRAHALEGIKSAFDLACAQQLRFWACRLDECSWMTVWPLPVCDSWHMATLYLHQPESTPQTSAILAVHQENKLVLVIRTDS